MNDAGSGPAGHRGRREGRRPRILFVAAAQSPFVLDDRDLLAERYHVEPLWFDGRRLGRSLARQAATLARTKADLVFGWFADYHLVQPIRWASRRGVPSVVVLGGYDAVHLPSLGYGVFGSVWRAPLARDVCRRTTHLLPVASALVESVNAFATWPEPTAQGVRTHVPGLTTPTTVLPTGYDPEAWPMGKASRPASVLTVARVTDERTYRLKGLDLIEAAAGQRPGVPFEVVGVDPTVASRPVPPNLALRPPVPREALAARYAAASVYVQPSRSEGLPNALCEAMLAGCIPVASPVGGMPEAVGEYGTVVSAPTGEALAEAVRTALASEQAGRRDAIRERARSRYGRARRRDGLYALLDGLLSTR
ncbi:MAG: glycosyltransferase family 4 protein [Bacteroidota bacterium]